MQLITSLFIASAVLCASVSLAAPTFDHDEKRSVNSTGVLNELEVRATPPAIQAVPAANFLQLSAQGKKDALDFIQNIIPLQSFQDAGNTGAIGTIFTADASGNPKVPRPKTGFRLDRQSTPSSGSGLVANVQLQKNGVDGISTVAGILLQGVPIPPLTVKAKLIDSLNKVNINTIPAPQATST